MHLNKSTNHAIRVLIACANSEDRLIKVAEISKLLGITPQNTFKIVHILSRAGFVEAVRGRHGGVRLAMTAKEIRIGDVVREIEAGLVGVRSSVDQKSAVGFDLLVDDAFKAFLTVLDGQTLSDMAKEPRKKSAATRKKNLAKGHRSVSLQRSKVSPVKRSKSTEKHF